MSPGTSTPARSSWSSSPMALCRDCARAAAGMADAAVPQLDQVVDHVSDAAPVRCAYDVDGAAGHAPADDDNRRPSRQFRHGVVAELGTQQNQGFAPKAEQGLDDVGFGHDVLDQFRVKCAANIGHNADEV